jgi:hypothetical protein
MDFQVPSCRARLRTKATVPYFFLSVQFHFHLLLCLFCASCIGVTLTAEASAETAETADMTNLNITTYIKEPSFKKK